jgi:hypothetical protein
MYQSVERQAHEEESGNCLASLPVMSVIMSNTTDTNRKKEPILLALLVFDCITLILGLLSDERSPLLPS